MTSEPLGHGLELPSGPARPLAVRSDIPGELPRIRAQFEDWVASTRHRGVSYAAQALLHPLNLVMLFIATAAVLITGSLWPLVGAGVGEVLTVAVVSRSRYFRRRVDEQLADAERAALAKARETLLVQLEDRHRQEFERLELIVGSIRENARRHGGAVPMIMDQHLDLGRLTGSYLRLAIAYREGQSFLAMVDRNRLDEDLTALSRLVEYTSSERLQKLAQQRLSIARKRAAHWDRTRENLEVISHQLATIAEIIHLLHAQSLAPFSTEDVGDAIDQFLADLRETESTWTELAELADEHRLYLSDSEQDSFLMALGNG